ncbi:MAG: DUF4157 domain-containing protein, partial [Myxococcales bacterium]|nr:DUF4157 domain-containing protein [Myxococcales bacterium]
MDTSARGGVQELAAAGVAGSAEHYPHAQAIQSAFGRHSIDGIGAHTGPEAQLAARSLHARAYAMGDRVAFSKPTPSLAEAAHEAAHVVQQRAGVTLEGGVGRSGDRYEQQADRVAAAVVEGRSAEAELDGVSAGARSSSGDGGVQMMGEAAALRSVRGVGIKTGNQVAPVRSTDGKSYAKQGFLLTIWSDSTF